MATSLRKGRILKGRILKDGALADGGLAGRTATGRGPAGRAPAIGAFAVGALSALVIACSPRPEPGAPEPGPPAAKAQIGAWGLDLTARNPGVRPGDDFFAYVNGGWLATYEIPADRSSYGMFHKLDELSETRLKEIIEAKAATKAAPGAVDQKVGDFYASFMDGARIESLGLTPLKADLDRIAAARTATDLSALFGARGFASPIDLGVWEDLKTPTAATVYVSQSGLGLPDRDYYLRQDAKFKEIRAAYEAYLAQILTLAGEPTGQAATRARAVMALETRIAAAHWPAEQTRDIDRTYNPRSRSQIKAFAPGLDWDAFFAAADLGRRDAFVLSEMSALKTIAALVRRERIDVWRDYLRVHLLSDHARYLPKAFDDARFAFYGRTLRGQGEQRARWKRGVELVDTQIGEAVGKVYVEKYFPPEAKAKMELLVANLRAALRQRIEALEWMTPETKAKALAKLATFDPKIGYPEKFRDYADLEIRRDDLIGNVRRATASNWRYEVGKLERPVDRTEWAMTPQTVNAYYNPTKNEIVFPAAILQPPFFDPAADDAVNYGAIGAVIGHEIGHGFDDQGAKFDGEGKLADWWNDRDGAAFAARGRKLVEQYSAYEPLPGLKVNGQLTLGENIGDLGGVNMAYHAYRMSLNGKEAPVLDGLTGDQRFFLSWAQVWRSKYRDEALREQVLSDPHSPARYRVNGVVRNVDAWYAAFGVTEADALYLKPAERVSIW